MRLSHTEYRDLFEEAVYACWRWKTGASEPTVEVEGRPRRISAVFKNLWCCSDLLPGELAVLVEDMDGSKQFTFAGAARVLKPLVKARVANTKAAEA